MENFGDLGKEGGDFIDQLAASIVGGTDGGPYIHYNIVVWRIAISTTTTV